MVIPLSSRCVREPIPSSAIGRSGVTSTATSEPISPKYGTSDSPPSSDGHAVVLGGANIRPSSPWEVARATGGGRIRSAPVGRHPAGRVPNWPIT